MTEGSRASIKAARRAARAQRHELHTNTVAAWIWSQGTLVASVISLPLLTHLLPKSEMGLWSQLLALMALAIVAGLGMASVFIRRLAAYEQAHNAVRLKLEVGAAQSFYAIAGLLLVVVLLLVTLVPGGIIQPFVGVTYAPRLTAVLVIVAIITNFVLCPYALVLYARGKMARAIVFGSGPALAGTLLGLVAAVAFRTAFAVAGVYVVVELAFNLVLVLTVKIDAGPLGRRRDSTDDGGVPWRELFKESWGILIIESTPQLVLLVDSAIVGRTLGAALVAEYAVAMRVSEVIPRFFSPLTSSLFVSLCRAGDRDRRDLQDRTTALGWSVLLLSLSVTCLMIAVGPRPMEIVFGRGYGHAIGAAVVLLIAATVRATYQPGLLWVQARGGLGPVPPVFVAGLGVHVILGYVLTVQWSIVGTAVAVVIVALGVEGPAIFYAARRLGAPGLEVGAAARAQLGCLALGSAAAGGLAWSRLHGGKPAVIGSAIAAVATGSVGAVLMMRYVMSLGRVGLRVGRDDATDDFGSQPGNHVAL